MTGWEYFLTAAMIPGSFLLAGAIVYYVATRHQHDARHRPQNSGRLPETVAFGTIPVGGLLMGVVYIMATRGSRHHPRSPAE
jgi:hypothetical protein